MLSFERRWAHAILRAIAGLHIPEHAVPGDAVPGDAVPEDAVDYLATLQQMRREATPKAALGLRAAVWLVAWAPLWLWGKRATVGSLPEHERSALLAHLLRHRRFVVREGCALLKLVASFALFRSNAFRARSGDGGSEQRGDGTRRLPLALFAGASRASGKDAA